MTARAMLLSNEEIMSHAELAASSTCFLLGAQYARSIYEADRAKLLDEIEVLKLAKQELRDGLIKVGALLETALPKEGE